MYIVVAGGGKVGRNLTLQLMDQGHEVTLIEKEAARYRRLEEQFEHLVQWGDACELHVLERCGVQRADMVVVVTGDDEDNVIVAQLAKKHYGVERVVVRVNDPRNQEIFDQLDILPTVCATTGIMRLIEHELPEHAFVLLLAFRREGIEIVEVRVASDRNVDSVALPEGARLIARLRADSSDLVEPGMKLSAGDELLVVVKGEHLDAVRHALS